MTIGSVPILDPLLVGADRVRALAAPASRRPSPVWVRRRPRRGSTWCWAWTSVSGARARATRSPTDWRWTCRGISRESSAAATVEVVPRGEASTGRRLVAACEKHARNEVDVVLRGGSHSDYDPEIIHKLSSLDRLFGAGNINGIIPGELAAFVALSTPRFAGQQGLEAWARLHSVGTGFEKAGPDNDEPAFEALGLTQALRTATAAMDAENLRVGWMLTDMTAETHRIHEWHCAYVRTQKYLCDPQWIDSPAHRLGRLGAAALPLQIAIATTAWRHRFAPHPLVLSYVGSDSGERVATLWSDARA